MSQTVTGVNAAAAVRDHRRRLLAGGRVPGLIRGEFAAFPSGLTEAPGELLRDLVVQARATRTIETGFALGLSALFILEGLLTQGEEALHTAVDPFQERDWEGAGIRSVRDAGAERWLRLIGQDSALALPALVSAAESFDLAFIDGGHHFEYAILDLVYMLRLVRPGGLIVLDDVWMPAVKAAVQYGATNLGLDAVVDHSWKPAAARRFAVLRAPERSLNRAWDHFVPFWTDTPPLGRVVAG